MAAETDGEEVVSMHEVLRQQQYLDEAVECLLGCADDEKCSYSQGYMKRQPLYSCLTCTRDLSSGPTGLCLACSLHCHDGHEFVELYTKRNFRCDCGNSKFNEKLHCKLDPLKESLNELNLYNQNFQGLYCTCRRPYPDPDCSDEDVMIQCIACEDWFHAEHVGIESEGSDFEEMVCPQCAVRLQFLQGYSIQSAEKDDERGSQNSETTADESGNKLCLKPDCTSMDLQKALIFKTGWRSELCRCADCLAVYRSSKCEFLLENEDTLEFFEQAGRTKNEQERAGSSTPSHHDQQEEKIMNALKKMDRFQQGELILGYKDMTTELSRFLESFAAEGKVVKESDIHEFFEELKAKKRRRLNDNGDFSSI